MHLFSHLSTLLKQDSVEKCEDRCTQVHCNSRASMHAICSVILHSSVLLWLCKWTSHGK